MTPTPEEIAGLKAIQVSGVADLLGFFAGLLFSKSWRMAIKYGFASFIVVTFVGTVAGWLPLALGYLDFWIGTFIHMVITLLMASVGYFLRWGLIGLYRKMLWLAQRLATYRQSR